MRLQLTEWVEYKKRLPGASGRHVGAVSVITYTDRQKKRVAITFLPELVKSFGLDRGSKIQFFVHNKDANVWLITPASPESNPNQTLKVGKINNRLSINIFRPDELPGFNIRPNGSRMYEICKEGLLIYNDKDYTIDHK